MKQFWESMNKVDRCDFMQSLYFDKELGKLEYIALPTHVRIGLVFVWNKKYKHELNL